MSRFVLVHGSWHGAWCWDRVVPLLEAAGHEATALDLPGHGEDRTRIEDISLDAYARRICDVLAAQPEPVNLVGHSMGGSAITQAAEYAADSIASLIYLTAYINQPGESLVDLASADVDSDLRQNVIVDEASGTAHLDDSVLRECFYADCTPGDLSHASANLRPEPLTPLITPLCTGPGGNGRGASAIPKIYIECLQDRAITPKMQRRIHRRAGCERVYSMDTSHSPFFSTPAELVSVLIAASEGHPES